LGANSRDPDLGSSDMHASLPRPERLIVGEGRSNRKYFLSAKEHGMGGNGTDFIIDALAAGAASGTALGIKDATSTGIIGAYQRLKNALHRAFGGDRAVPVGDDDELALYERDSQTGEGALRERISATGAHLNAEVIQAAQRLLSLVGAEQYTAGWPEEAQVRVINSQGVQLNTGQGGGEQHNYFGH
jgi:hypothetical protein